MSGSKAVMIRFPTTSSAIAVMKCILGKVQDGNFQEFQRENEEQY